MRKSYQEVRPGSTLFDQRPFGIDKAEKKRPGLHQGNPGHRPCAKGDRCNANREHASHQYASGDASWLIGESR